MASLIIGGAAGGICYFAVRLRSKIGLDDSLDVVGVHGVGGAWGALATGLFATIGINAAGGSGLFYGNPGQLGIQFVATAASWIYSAIMTFVLLKIVDALVGLRVPQHEELAGLDVTQHGELAYQV
jgi:Amt family ammonium transporter